MREMGTGHKGYHSLGPIALQVLLLFQVYLQLVEKIRRQL